MATRKKDGVYAQKFKLAAVHRLQGGEAVSVLARELGVRQKLLYAWQEYFRNGGAEGLRGRGRPSVPAATSVAVADELTAARARIAELERKVGQQALDLDFFQQALRQVGAPRRRNGGRGGPGSTGSSK